MIKFGLSVVPVSLPSPAATGGEVGLVGEADWWWWQLLSRFRGWGWMLVSVSSRLSWLSESMLQPGWRSRMTDSLREISLKAGLSIGSS